MSRLNTLDLKLVIQKKKKKSKLMGLASVDLFKSNKTEIEGGARNFIENATEMADSALESNRLLSVDRQTFDI